MGAGFTAKIKIKRKTLPTQPIHVRIDASPEGKSEGGAMGSSSPRNAEAAAFSFPSSPRPKLEKGVKKMSARKASFK